MTLPKPGTKVEDLKCEKCGAAFKDKRPQDCQDADCFHKAKPSAPN